MCVDPYSFGTLQTAIAYQRSLQEIISARKQKDEEECHMLSLFQEMYSKWCEVQEWRTEKRKQYINSLNTNDQQEMDSQMQKSMERSNDKKMSQSNANQFQNTPNIQSVPIIKYIGYPLVFKAKKLKKQNTEIKNKLEQEIDDEVQEEKEVFQIEKKIMDIKNGKYRKNVPFTTKENKYNQYKNNNRSPITFNDNMRREKIKRRKPNFTNVYEPILFPVTITPDKNCPSGEKKRRKNIKNKRFNIALIINNRIIHRTKVKHLQFPSFKIEFDVQWSLRMSEIPELIQLQIFSFSLLGSSKPIAEININLPRSGVHIHDAFYFTGINIAHSMSDKSLITFTKKRNICGILDVSVFWEKDELSKYNKKNEFTYEHATACNEKNCKEETSSWLAAIDDDNRFDEHDPLHTTLISEKIHNQSFDYKKGNEFSYSKYPKGILLVDPKYYVPPARKKVLRTRNESVLLSKQRIPLNDNEIPSDLFELIRISSHGLKKEAESRKTASVLDDAYEQDFEKIRTKAQAAILNLKNQITDVEEVVREGEWHPPWRVQQNRPLYGSSPSIQHKKTMIPYRNKITCKLIIHLIQGHNFPIRDMDSKESNGSFVVQVKFNNQSETSVVATGVHPSWNQLLVLDFSPPHDSFAPKHLQQLTDTVLFNIFDEVIFDQEAKVGEYNLENTRNIHKQLRWIGSIEIPFTAIYLNHSTGLFGKFPVKIPPVHIGYSHGISSYSSPFSSRPCSSFVFSSTCYSSLSSSICYRPFLSIYARFDPFLPLSTPVSISSCKTELAFCKELEIAAKSKVPSSERYILTLASDINGSLHCACSYITPQIPPEPFKNDEDFVWMVLQIPFVVDFHLSNGATNIWYTSSEFLILGEGNWEDHAILLCNYYIWYENQAQKRLVRFHWNTYVLLGHANIGKVAWVLQLKSENKSTQKRVINPLSGRKYNLNKQSDVDQCPLKDIGTLIGIDNIFINLQEPGSLQKLKFDLMNSREWSSLSSEDSKRADGIMQKKIQQPIRYWRLKDEEKYCTARAYEIEKIIKNQFEQWRMPEMNTKWHYGVCKMLKECINKIKLMEQRKNMGPSLINNQIRKIKKIFPLAHGFPFHFSEAGNSKFILNSIDDNPIIKEIYNTQIHRMENQNALFALEVAVYPCVNRICSVWVFIVALAKNNDS